MILIMVLQGEGGKEKDGEKSGGEKKKDKSKKAGLPTSIVSTPLLLPECIGKRVCHPGRHYWKYCIGALSLNQVTATHLKIGHL